MLKKRNCAIFTVVRNENFFLPIWYKYYSKHFSKEDIFILDHQSTDSSTNIYKNVIQIENNFTQDHNWMANISNEFQKYLLSRYKWVLFSHADEIICPDYDLYCGLEDFLIKNKKSKNFRCKGYEVIQFPEEKPIDKLRPLLSQRNYWFQNDVYSKPLITKIPIKWTPGWHGIQKNNLPIREDLLLIHLHRLDFDFCKQKRISLNNQKIYKKDLERKWGWYVYIDQEYYKKWFYDVDCSKILDAEKSFFYFEKNKIKSENQIVEEARLKCEIIEDKWKNTI